MTNKKHILATPEMHTTIVEYEIAHKNDLVRETMKFTEINDVLDMFQGNPDELRVNGDTVFFIDLEDRVSNRRTAVYVDSSYKIDEKDIVKRLTEFYSKDQSEYEIFNKFYDHIESTRENMDNLKNGIAYRGGKGYTYSLHQYKQSN